MEKLPAILYVQDSGDRRVGLILNRTPEGALDQDIKDAGKVVGVYEMTRLVTVSVSTPIPEVQVKDLPVPEDEKKVIVGAPHPNPQR